MNKIMEKPIPSFIIVMVLSFIVCNIISGIFTPFFTSISPDNPLVPGLIIGAVVTSLIYVYIFKIKGFFSFSKFNLAFILGCPLILYILASLFDSNFIIPTTDALLIGILLGLSPGICEEILFRGILISYLMKFFRNSKNIYIILIFSALIFGLSHITNVFMGAPLDSSLFQAFYTFSMGIILGAVYLRTGNIWIPIIFHSLIDIIGISFFNSQSMIIQTGFVLDIVSILTIIVSIICIVLGLYYVRSAKHDEILEVWEEKWAN